MRDRQIVNKQYSNTGTLEDMQIYPSAIYRYKNQWPPYLALTMQPPIFFFLRVSKIYLT